MLTRPTKLYPSARLAQTVETSLLVHEEGVRVSFAPRHNFGSNIVSLDNHEDRMNFYDHSLPQRTWAHVWNRNVATQQKRKRRGEGRRKRCRNRSSVCRAWLKPLTLIMLFLRLFYNPYGGTPLKHVTSYLNGPLLAPMSHLAISFSQCAPLIFGI